jgi:hypothetical protein
MPKPCLVRHPHHGQTVPAIHVRPTEKTRFLHFVASGELGKAEAVVGVLRTSDGKNVKGTTKTKPTDKSWIIMFHAEGPDPKTVYDLEIQDANGAVVAVCKNIQFTEGKNSLTITSPTNETVCPTFTSYGTSTSTSLIQTAGCQVGGAAANVTIVQDTDQNGAWIVKFNNADITFPQTTSITVAQQDGTNGTNTGITVVGCTNFPP